MDFGCGTGVPLPLLEDILHAEQVIGLDASEESLAVARESIGAGLCNLQLPPSIFHNKISTWFFAMVCFIIYRSRSDPR